MNGEGFSTNDEETYKGHFKNSEYDGVGTLKTNLGTFDGDFILG